MYMEFENQAQLMISGLPFSVQGRLPISGHSLECTPGQTLGDPLLRSLRHSPECSLRECGASGRLISPKVIDYQGESVIFRVDCIWFTSTCESQSKSFAAQILQELLLSLDAKGFTSNETPLMGSKSGSGCGRVKHEMFLKKPLGSRLPKSRK